MKYKLLITVFSFITSSLSSQDTYIQKKIYSHFENLTIIECSYHQKKQLSMLKEPLISTGIFKYNKDGEISWEQETPFKEIFLINKDSDNKLDKYVSQFIMSILSGKILKDKKINVTYLEELDNYIVIINPIKDTIKSYIKSITLTFNKKNIALNKLEIISKNNDITIINFFNK